MTYKNMLTGDDDPNFADVAKKYEAEVIAAGEGKKPVRKKKLSKEEAFDLTKAEQISLLEKLGAKKIPVYEKDRVVLILKLQ